jgi:hypothetical protein
VPVKPEERIDEDPSLGNAGRAAPLVEFDAKSIVTRLDAADPEKRANEFGKCAACHSASPGIGSKVGPNLWNVVERPKAALPDVAYSEALASKGGTWTKEDLAAICTIRTAAASPLGVKARRLVAGPLHVLRIAAAVLVDTLRRQFEHTIG